ncbi:ArnT family glycosyltransferase [Nocardia arthritidis]|uniref:ABC transporter n=1 Tax=Nocardia arthritidis TaxID=228602 RepID=A0A6G9Y8Q1_9NOCA|nr:glycosyltransferase family 39 protein [Nocardia arthritidis]QIS09524.1 ABC transporter [Nocardia arthritidis]
MAPVERDDRGNTHPDPGNGGAVPVPRRVSWCVFGAATLLYLVFGVLLSVGHGFLMGDALSRVQATEAALFSRDPHLSAIGFVFTPLTSLAQLPFVAFAPLLPWLTHWGISGALMSALFMGGAVLMIYGIGTDRGLPWWMVAGITAAFALNPMVVFYGANGMSEAPFLFCLCWAMRRLIRWVRTDDAHDLTACGIAFGLAYLTRYDAVAPAVVAGGIVFALTYLRGKGERNRWYSAFMDLVLVGAPGALAFLVWALTSWLITGQAFQQFTSQYGNSSILAQSGAQGEAELAAALEYSIGSILILGPALPILIPIVAALAWRRRDPEVLVPLLLCGAVLGFQALSYASGSTFAFLRFYVAAIPLAAVLALQITAARGFPPSRRPGRHAVMSAPTRAFPAGKHAARPAVGLPELAMALAMCLIAVSVPLTGWGMTSQKMAVQEYALKEVLFPEPDNATPYNADQRRIAATFSTERKIANYLDAQHLPRGTVLMDTVYGFAVSAASRHPDQFVIPSDRDFVRVLNRPAERGVKYILAVPNEGRGTSDAVNRRYPTIYENGAGVATLAMEIPNDGAGQPNWRLYQVLGAN